MKIKKNYQKPEMEMVEMNTEEAIVVGSVNQMGNRDPGNIQIGVSNSGFFSKGNIMGDNESSLLE